MKQKKNICLSITSLAVGGAEKQCLLLADALGEVYTVFVVIAKKMPQFQGHLDFIKEKKLNITFLDGNPLTKISQLTSFLNANKIDVCISYLPADVFYMTIAARRAGIGCIIGGIRNAKMDSRKAKILRFLHNRYLYCSISNSHSGKDFFAKRGFQRDKIKVIPNGIGINLTSLYRDTTDREELVILSVGRFVDQKDYHTALKSIAHLKNNYTLKQPIKYWIVGYGEKEKEQEIRTWAKDFGLENTIQFFINPSNIPDLYRAADIYLSTSLFEGLSNSIMEAMNFALPIVATDAGDNNKLAKNEINGYLVPLKAVEQIASSLHLLISDDNQRLAMGQASYEYLKNEYSLEVFKQHYLQFLSPLTGQSAPPPIKKEVDSRKNI